jgi:hypothetical protein
VTTKEDSIRFIHSTMMMMRLDFSLDSTESTPVTTWSTKYFAVPHELYELGVELAARFWQNGRSKTPQARGNGQTPKGNPNEAGERFGRVWPFNSPKPPKSITKTFRHSAVHLRLSAISTFRLFNLTTFRLFDFPSFHFSTFRFPPKLSAVTMARKQKRN